MALTNNDVQRFVTINSVLYRNGYKDPLRAFVIAQTIHETGNFTSPLYLSGSNNLTGIKYAANSPYQSGAHGAYATYSSLDNWAKDLARIISRKGSAGIPANAQTITQYAHLLKANKYYGATESAYLSGLNQALRQVSQLVNAYNGVANNLAAGKIPKQNPSITRPMTKEELIQNRLDNHQPLLDVGPFGIPINNSNNTPGTEIGIFDWMKANPVKTTLGALFLAALLFKR